MIPATAQTVRVGIIGLGRSGWNIHAHALSGLPDLYRVVAVADPVAERLDEGRRRFGAGGYEQAEALIADPDVDLVVVSTPTNTHLPLGLAAVRAGKHLLLEKPMVRDVAELDELQAAAEAASTVVTCFHNNRFEPSFQAVCDTIASGRIGDPVLIRRTYHRYGRRADWQSLRVHGGGELANTGSHAIDQMLRMYPGREIELSADLRRTITVGDAEDHIKLMLQIKDGPLYEIEASATIALPQPTWWVAGTAGGLSVSGDRLEVRWLDPDTFGALVPEPGAAPGRLYTSEEPPGWSTETIRLPPGDQRAADYYRSLHGALTGSGEPPVSFADIRLQLELIARARASGVRPPSPA
ncbi:Gfo/Idh/MocA family protein [Occultella aeris]|uniref:Putative oxidoreductase YvaA n=1 Tax=Occultella aeris TaxID=2761496 RepID=A0A7M4DFI8_9MICO|nr:Gfo/Idh/MocA family oxidoreductase [Occultella aeris]VZO35681.1 putative oxidoreductase YvaA [Occultella aeris]